MSGTCDADVQAAFAATLVDEWVRSGVTDAVVSPGSRSTPVLAALADDGRLRLHVVLDERSAGFVALGLALATGRPAPVVTTSGTASVELHAAVVEAHQARVPLLAVTADRPPELHHVGAPQTIDQHGLFGGATRWNVSPGVPDPASMGSWRSLASRSVAATISGPGGPGPVHLNLALREPLLGDPSRFDVPPGRPGGRPWHARTDAGNPTPTPELVELIVAHAGRRGVLVVGADPVPSALVAGPLAGPDAVAEMARRLGWPVFADTRSRSRLPEPGVVGAFDALLRAAPVRDWSPEIVVRLGPPLASKVLGQWLAGLPPDIPQVLVDPDGTWPDPDRRVEHVSSCTPEMLAAGVIAGLDDVSVATGWLPAWRAAEAAAQAAIDDTLSPTGASSIGASGTGALTEPAIARLVSAALPDGAVLMASSSMPVRDLEWFAAPRRDLRVVSNRGANGIDGVVSTALGVALGGRPTVALIGDLAFAYDLGALLWAADRDIDCTYVLVDNDGGGIFSFLPQAEQLAHERFERLWGTPHGLDLLAIASAYGLECRDVGTPDELVAALRQVGGGRGVRVLRCRSERGANVVAHEALQAAVAVAVAGLGAPRLKFEPPSEPRGDRPRA